MPERRAVRGGTFSTLILEEKLQRKLHQSGIFGLRDLAELRPVRAAPVWVIELGVVKDVEELATEIDVHRVRDRKSLQHRKIAVADVGPAADCASDVARRPQE